MKMRLLWMVIQHSILTTLLLCLGCRPSQPIERKSYIPQLVRHQKSSGYKRDSLYLHYTVEEFIKTGYYRFHHYKTFNIAINPASIRIDSIVYSPDTLKLVAFVVVEVPNNGHFAAENRTSYLDGYSLIGFRSHKDQPWTVYQYMQYSASGFSDYPDLRQSFRNFYFRKLKTVQEYTYESPGNWPLVLIGYNLDEAGFWNESVVWKKGSLISSYYNFQLKGKYGPGEEKRGVVPFLEINYPKNLLDRFK